MEKGRARGLPVVGGLISLPAKIMTAVGILGKRGAAEDCGLTL